MRSIKVPSAVTKDECSFSKKTLREVMGSFISPTLTEPYAGRFEEFWFTVSLVRQPVFRNWRPTANLKGYRIKRTKGLDDWPETSVKSIEPRINASEASFEQLRNARWTKK